MVGNDLKREGYKIYLQEILRRQLSNTENYDKTFLTIASSALGFSLLAIRYLVSLHQSY